MIHHQTVPTARHFNYKKSLLGNMMKESYYAPKHISIRKLSRGGCNRSLVFVLSRGQKEGHPIYVAMSLWVTLFGWLCHCGTPYIGGYVIVGDPI